MAAHDRFVLRVGARLPLSGWRYRLAGVAAAVGMAAGGSPALGSESFAAGPGGIIWQDRVLPLPQEMAVSDCVTLPAAQIRLQIRAAQADASPMRTARDLLAFAAGDETASGATITLVDAERAGGLVPEAVLERLAALPNADQAYAVFPRHDASLKLVAVARTPIGLMYAARTLRQLTVVSGDPEPDMAVTLPVVTIVDWPDIALRGEWGGAVLWNMDWYARWKLNMYNVMTRSRLAPDAAFEDLDLEAGGVMTDVSKMIEVSDALGYRLVPYIGHLGKQTAWLEHDEIQPALDEQGEARDNSFCWSDPDIVRLLATHMRRVVSRFAGVSRDIKVWLSESGETNCHCAACKGGNGYLMELEGILAAWKAVRETFPDLRLVLMLSQGSRLSGANDAILAVARDNPDIGVSYYDGHVTYGINDEPLIFPALAALAEAGCYVDVVPALMQYTVPVPQSMPQFVRFRMREFASRKLTSVTVFTERDRRFCEVNLAAYGEYAWNAEGRSPHAFARAYATRTGVAEPGAFARWLDRAGPAAWSLIMTGFHGHMANGDYTPPLKTGDPAAFRETVANALAALDLARKIENEWILLESETTLARLRLLVLMRRIERHLQEADMEALGTELVEADKLAHLIRANAYEWQAHNGERLKAEADEWWYWIHPLWHLNSTGLPPRMEMAAYSPLRTVDRVVEQAAAIGVDDPRQDRAPREIGTWTPEMFGADGDANLNMDLSEHVPIAGGPFILGMYFQEGESVRFYEKRNREPILSLRAVDMASGTERTLPCVGNPWLRSLGAGRLHWAHNTLLDIPAREPGERLYLHIGMRGGGQGSSGVATLRRVVPVRAERVLDPDAVPADYRVPEKAAE